MNIISGITNAPRQNITIALPDNSYFTLRLTYLVQQSGWFYDVEYKDFVLNGARLVPSPNIFRKYQKLIPFGLGILTQGNVEPTTIDAFSSGLVTIYLLTQTEAEQLETDLWEASA